MSGSSAYNPVERRMVLLSEDTSDVILSFNTYEKYFHASNKTIDMELEIKDFKAAGKILAEIWSESIINSYPIEVAYVDPHERNRIRKMEDSSCTAIIVHATNNNM